MLFKAGADPAEARRLREEADAVGALLCGALRDIDDADAIQGLCAVLSPPPSRAPAAGSCASGASGALTRWRGRRSTLTRAERGCMQA